MTADVYAGDEDKPVGAGSLSTFTFSVIADGNPDVLLRVAAQLLLANVPPFCLTMTTELEEQVRIDAELRDVSPVIAESIRHKLMQLSCVETVAVQDENRER